MDPIAPVGAAVVTPVTVSAAPIHDVAPPDPVAAERFAARLHSTPENHLGPIGYGLQVDSSARRESARVVTMGATEEAGRSNGNTPYERVFRFFTQSEDPLMGDMPRTREILTNPPQVNGFGDLMRAHKGMLEASAEISFLNVKTSLLMQTGFEAKKSVEKLVQQQS